MKTQLLAVLAAALIAVPLPAQQASGSRDQAEIQVGRVGHPLPMHRNNGPSMDGTTGTPVHPIHYVARHPKPGCKVTTTCGTIFAEGDTHNLRTSVGTTWQYNQMAGSTAAVGTYLALTNTAITPAESDTVLTGEITTNGLGRSLATAANLSTTLTVPGTPTATVYGTVGSTTYYYWVAACNQGICTTPSAASGSVTTANATLSTSNYVGIAFTGQNGAATYQVYRTTSNTTPGSGAGTVLVNGQPSCTIGTATVAPSCVVYDQSNTLLASNVAASNLTNFGKYSLVFTWTCSGSSQSAQAFGVFNASSSGTLIFEGIFTPVSLNPGDTFQLSEQIFF